MSSEFIKGPGLKKLDILVINTEVPESVARSIHNLDRQGQNYLAHYEESLREKEAPRQTLRYKIYKKICAVLRKILFLPQDI